MEDQQLAGLIMWVPGGIGSLVATLWLVAAWLRAPAARGATITGGAPVTLHHRR